MNPNNDAPAPLKRRTIHFGKEYGEAFALAAKLGAPWTGGSFIRQVLKDNLKAAKSAARKTKPAVDAEITRETVRLGPEYADAIAYAADLGKPWSGGSLVRFTVKRFMRQTFAALKGRTKGRAAK